MWPHPRIARHSVCFRKLNLINLQKFLTSIMFTFCCWWACWALYGGNYKHSRRFGKKMLEETTGKKKFLTETSHPALATIYIFDITATKMEIPSKWKKSFSKIPIWLVLVMSEIKHVKLHSVYMESSWILTFILKFGLFIHFLN